MACASLALMSFDGEADPPWELPNYVGEFARFARGRPQALDGEWGSCCTFGHGALWNLPLTRPDLPVPSDGESEVGASERGAPNPNICCPVQRLDEVEHVLTSARGP